MEKNTCFPEFPQDVPKKTQPIIPIWFLDDSCVCDPYGSSGTFWGSMTGVWFCRLAIASQEYYRDVLGPTGIYRSWCRFRLFSDHVKRWLTDFNLKLHSYICFPRIPGSCMDHTWKSPSAMPVQWTLPAISVDRPYKVCTQCLWPSSNTW
jgi:hypothetical protein